MKFRIRPKTGLSNELIMDYLNRTYFDFLSRTNTHYFYWDELHVLDNLPYPELSDNWSLVKLHRRGNYGRLNFGDKHFHYYITPSIQKQFYNLDLKLIGGLYDRPISAEHQQELLQKGIYTEIYHTSRWSGAVLSLPEAVRFLDLKQPPGSEAEQILLNAQQAMTYVVQTPKQSLTPRVILEIHQLLTIKTHAGAGVYRTGAHQRGEKTESDIPFHFPPATIIPEFISQLCEFVNQPMPFIHPLAKAFIVQFMINYIHPFAEGNGRVSRALFYWVALKEQYDIISYLSISEALLQREETHHAVFEKVVKDENDLTYFIQFACQNLWRAFENLRRFRDRMEHRQRQSRLIAYQLIQSGLRPRQAETIGQLYTREIHRLNITDYAGKYGIVRQTAAKDLRELVKTGLVKEERKGRDKWYSLCSDERINQFLQAR